MMSREARVEELSESDPDEVDISTIASGSNASPSTATNPTLIDPSQIPSTRGSSVTREKAKSWQCLYPLYFDARRTRAEGRRVASQLAVENPLAREIADAVWSLNLQLAIEPEKTHPKDWANPGRIRVLVKENGKAANRNVKNSTSRIAYTFGQLSNFKILSSFLAPDQCSSSLGLLHSADF